MPMLWPESLPQQFDKDGYQDAFADNRHNTQTDLGPALIRSRVSSMPRRLGGRMIMTKTQLITLRAFWKKSTLEGKLPFLFPDPVFGYAWRHNYLPNTGYSGAVAGNPGTLPTYWSGLGAQNGINKRVDGIGVEGGRQYVDIEFSGVPNGSCYADIIFCPSTGDGAIAAASGQTWTQSLYVRMTEGGKADLADIDLLMANYPVTASLGTSILSKVTTAALSGQRYQHTWKAEGTGMTGLTARIRVTGKVNDAMNITLRVAWPQVEKYKEATAYMPQPSDARPITRFAAGGRPPQPMFLGGNTWAVNMELEIFEL